MKDREDADQEHCDPEGTFSASATGKAMTTSESEIANSTPGRPIPAEPSAAPPIIIAMNATGDEPKRASAELCGKQADGKHREEMVESAERMQKSRREAEDGICAGMRVRRSGGRQSSGTPAAKFSIASETPQLEHIADFSAALQHATGLPIRRRPTASLMP